MLLKYFSGADNPRKKEPVLEIVVTLFKVYFELNTLRLCKNLSNAVDRLDFNIFPASSRISYKFYMGRLSIFDNDYVGLQAQAKYLYFLVFFHYFHESTHRFN